MVNKTEAYKAHQKEVRKYTKKTEKKIVLDKKQVKKAAKALKKYAENLKEQNAMKLLEQEDKFINVTILLSQVPKKYSPKPLGIELPHPIYGPKYDTRAMMFVKDPETKFKERIEDLNVPCLAEVMGFKKLLKDYERYKYKQGLVNDYELFFADQAIYKMLPKATGKFFYTNKKVPYPIDTTKIYGTELENLINDQFKKTFFHMRNGPNYTCKIGRSSMTTTQIYENLVAVVNHMLPHVMVTDSIKHSRVQCISLKVGESIDLPVFNQLMSTELASYVFLKDKIDEEKDEESDDAQNDSESSD